MGIRPNLEPVVKQIRPNPSPTPTLPKPNVIKPKKADKRINCVICGTSFSASRSTARYCSSSCKQKAYRIRNEDGKG